MVSQDRLDCPLFLLAPERFSKPKALNIINSPLKGIRITPIFSCLYSPTGGF